MAIERKPAPNDISSLESLKTNFAYSLIVNSKYRDEIEGYSSVELSQWIKAKGLHSDYDLLELVVNNEEVQDGE